MHVRRRPRAGVIDETWRRRIRTSDRPPPSPRATSRSSRRVVRVKVSGEGEPQIGGPLLLALMSTVPRNACVVPPSFGQVLRVQVRSANRDAPAASWIKSLIHARRLSACPLRPIRSSADGTMQWVEERSSDGLETAGSRSSVWTLAALHRRCVCHHRRVDPCRLACERGSAREPCVRRLVAGSLHGWALALGLDRLAVPRCRGWGGRTCGRAPSVAVVVGRCGRASSWNDVGAARFAADATLRQARSSALPCVVQPAVAGVASTAVSRTRRRLFRRCAAARS